MGGEPAGSAAAQGPVGDEYAGHGTLETGTLLALGDVLGVLTAIDDVLHAVSRTRATSRARLAEVIRERAHEAPRRIDYFVIRRLVGLDDLDLVSEGGDEVRVVEPADDQSRVIPRDCS
jgi:hypothetical protein